MSPERQPKLNLGSKNTVEDLVAQGRTPIFSEPQIDKVGSTRRYVICTIPAINGDFTQELRLSLPSATQIRRRVDRALGKNN